MTGGLLNALIVRVGAKANPDGSGRADAGTALLVGASALRTVLQFALLPLLAWRLAPEAYGLIGLAIPMIMAPRLFLDGGLESALVVAQDHSDRLEASSFWITLIAGCVAAVAVAACSPWIAQAFGEPSLAPLLIVLSPILILSALCTVPNARLMRNSRLSSFAVSDIGSALGGSAIAVFGAFHGWDVWSLASQQLALWIIKYGLVTWMTGFRPALFMDLRMIRSRAMFGVYNIGGTLIEFLQRNVGNLAIGGFVGVQALGYYSMSYQIMLLPLTVIAAPISTAVFTSIARASRSTESVGDEYLKALGKLAILLAPGMVGLALVADLATVGILGAKWAPAAPVLALLMPAGFIQCLMQLASATVLGMGSANLRFKLSILCALPALVGILLGVRYGITGVAAGMSIGFIVSFVPCTAITLRHAQVKLSSVISEVAAPFLATVVMSFAVVGFRLLHTASSPLIGLIECSALGAVSYVLSLFAIRAARSTIFTSKTNARITAFW
jgi:PST family polysaccharide transporter